MNDPFGHLERLQRELGIIAAQVTKVRFTYSSTADRWRPAINAYRCGDHFIICVDLAGADESSMQVLAEARRLIIRGQRHPPEPLCDQSYSVQILAMEIDYGPFERALELPTEIDPERVKAEHREGLLWVTLPLRDV